MAAASFFVCMSVGVESNEQNESCDDAKLITRINKPRSVYTNERN